ncbi:MAG: NUDIX hydrolase [Actinobacteria bacterium]|nr:NUDIX hydrolase [Actinomycetota bacterium]
MIAANNRDSRSRAGKPRPVVRAAAFIVREGAVLLVRQKKGDATYWLLPGGRVNHGETLVQAVVRELREELCLEVAVRTPPLGLAENIPPHASSGRHGITVVFAADITGEDQPRPGDPAVREYRWITADELPGLTVHPPIHDLLGEWLRHLSGESRMDPPPFRYAGPRWAD